MKQTRTRRSPIQPIQFVCLRCPQDKGVPLVRAKSDEHEAQCPRCHKYYRIDTYGLEGPPEEITLSATHSRYQFAYRDADGNPKTHTFKAQADLRYPDPNKTRFIDGVGNTITLIHSRGNLVEVTDQTRQLWVRIYADTARMRGAMFIATVGMLAYVLIAFKDSLSQAYDAIDAGPVVLWTIPAVFLLLVLLPVVAWILRPTK